MRVPIVGLAAIFAVAGLGLAARADKAKAAHPNAPAAGDAGAVLPPPGGYLPDPPPLSTRLQWVLDLAYRQGEVSFREARRTTLPRPTPTPRSMGRFAVELYVGRELIDRVRFDFPLLGAGEIGAQDLTWDDAPSFERRLSTSAAVMIPHSERATRALVVDRATGRQWPVPWPPDTAKAPSAHVVDAGPLDAGASR